METSDPTLEQLAKELYLYQRRLNQTQQTTYNYELIIRKIRSYMETHGFQFFNKQVVEGYVESILRGSDPSELSYNHQLLIRRVKSILEFQDTGMIRRAKLKNKPNSFTCSIGITMKAFIEHRHSLFQYSESTLKDYHHYLQCFLNFLNDRGINTIDQITSPLIVQHIFSIDPSKACTRNVTECLLKRFFTFLYDQNLLLMDYSVSIPKSKYIRQPKIPSTFTGEEISRLLQAVDRANPKGKRDYAILLLTIKLGMRVGDIRALKFENLLWDQSIILFQQQKTGKAISLPLLPEIGNAIINYLQYSRPVSSESNIFLQLIPPYYPLGKTDLTYVVHYHQKRAGINCKNRRHGPHSLRHSFADSLLKNKTPIPVIAEALGHSSTESTMFYLRIDSSSLKQCALEVPLVPSLFYQLEGGVNHG